MLRPRTLPRAGTLSLVLVLIAILATSLTAATTAEAAPDRISRDRAQHQGVGTRAVSFDVVNSNETSVPCVSDNREHRVRGRLVAPRAVLDGRHAVVRINVLVHDAGTGGWFWNLRSHPAYDYASKLAARGQTSIVLDRLGYGDSPLANGKATCLGAQAMMLHEVIQALYAGHYQGAGGAVVPNASHVVLQGHGTGATIAQLEAASFDDVQGLVLMSAPTTSPSQLALHALSRQSATCRQRSYAPFGQSVADYRHLLFRTAPGPVQRAAAAHREATPCGDVASVVTAVLDATLTAGKVRVPVLQLDGSADARRSGAAPAVHTSARLTRHTIRGAGSALPLERSAPHTRRLVLGWLKTLGGF